jgi:2-polyprenyl-3-methyl-5-hydroxy-6-metoxy-1,4-benzoquinol methylase
MIYVSPMPATAELAAHYQKAAYFEGEIEQGYLHYANMRKALLPHFHRRLNRLEKRLPHRGRLLDFGCAAGYFLEAAQARGWQIAGLELSHDMARHAERLLRVPIYTALETATERNCAAITLWEAIEHLPDPIGTLRQLRDRLQSGGVLMLSTPNTGHWQAVRAKDQWAGYRPPSHLLYFTRQTLHHALQRAGFVQVEITGAAPLPPLPRWLRRLSLPLEQALAKGQAKPWELALYAWRAIRVFGWARQKIAHRKDDIFATLELVAIRP